MIRWRWSVFGEEMKRVGYLAGPMINVTLSQYFLQIISMMMVGHLGKLVLSSTAIAISLCAVSGFSLIVSLFLSHLNLQFYKNYTCIAHLYTLGNLE